jgi:hypothetical protein
MTASIRPAGAAMLLAIAGCGAASTTTATPRADAMDAGPPVGAPLPAADASDTDVAAAWNSFLTNHPRGECAIDVPLSWLHEGCRALRPTQVATSAADASTLVHAFDLDACTIFDGGATPETIEIDLGQTETIDLIVLDPGPSMSGASRHVVEIPDRHDGWIARTVLYGDYYDDVLYALAFPEPITTQRLRVRTIESLGNVSFREIVPVACEGELAIHVEGIPPDPPAAPPPAVDWHDPQYRRVPGTGRCRRDADCVRQQCCAATSCGLARTAPDCSSVTCPGDCAGPMECGRGACICLDGTCAMATRAEPDALGL